MQKQKEGIQPRQQLSWFKITESRTSDKNPTPTQFEIPQEQRGWTCFIFKAVLSHALSKRHKEVPARAHMLQNHDGQKLRESRWFFGRLHSHATAIARKSNLQRMDERRRQLVAEFGHDIHNHTAPPAKQTWRQTWGCIWCRRHATEINGRTYKWMKEACKPHEGLKVKDASELRPSRREWQALQQQPEAPEKYKQVHGVTKQGGTGAEQHLPCQ